MLMLRMLTVFCMWDWNPNLTKSCLFLWSVTDVRLQGSDLEIVVLRTFAIMAPMLSVEWRRGRWYTFKVQALNVGRSTLGVNVQSRFRFRCDIEGQRHILQEQITFREIWILISHAKHCRVRGEISKVDALGMLTVRIFSQFSFQFSFQFSMENESKIKSKIEESTKMNLHGTFSRKAQFSFHFWVPFFVLGFILQFKFEGVDTPGWWHVAFGVWAACST